MYDGFSNYGHNQEKQTDDHENCGRLYSCFISIFFDW